MNILGLYSPNNIENNIIILILIIIDPVVNKYLYASSIYYILFYERLISDYNLIICEYKNYLLIFLLLLGYYDIEKLKFFVKLLIKTQCYLLIFLGYYKIMNFIYRI